MSARILIVDDAAFIRDLIKRTVRQKFPGVDLVEANDGRRAEALLRQAAAQKKSFDLVLSDWEMPEMSGEELLKVIRSDDALLATPFVMITSRGDKAHVAKAVQSGVNDFLSKPFNADELFRKVFKQLKRIGKLPQLQTNTKQNRDGAGASGVSLLTGGAPQTQTKTAVATANPFARPATAASVAAKVAPTKTKPKQTKVKGQAQLRFGEEGVECEVHELSLRGVSGVMQRPEKVPAVFDQAVVDIGLKGDIQRINAFVHSLEASTASPDATTLKVGLRFVDDDPTKMMALSKMIASGTGIQFTG